MRVTLWIGVYLAVAAALLAVALSPRGGEKALEERRRLSARMGLVSALASEALKDRRPEELADSLLGYKPGCSLYVADELGARLIVGEERRLPRIVPGRRELVADSPGGGWLVWRFCERSSGSTVVACAPVRRRPAGPGRALAVAGLFLLGSAACVHAVLSRGKESPRVPQLSARLQPEASARLSPQGRTWGPKASRGSPAPRGALGLAPRSPAGLGEIAKSQLLKELARKVRRCA